MEQTLKILEEYVCSDIFTVICDYFNWEDISCDQKLSEKFIEKHKNKF